MGPYPTVVLKNNVSKACTFVMRGSALIPVGLICSGNSYHLQALASDVSVTSARSTSPLFHL
jgi:hypothetical protein